MWFPHPHLVLGQVQQVQAWCLWLTCSSTPPHPLNCSCRFLQVVTCAMKEEKRSQVDMGDLSEDE